MVHNGSRWLAMVNTSRRVCGFGHVCFIPIPTWNPAMRLNNLTHVSRFVRIFRYPGSDIAIHILFTVDAMIWNIPYHTLPMSSCIHRPWAFRKFDKCFVGHRAVLHGIGPCYSWGLLAGDPRSNRLGDKRRGVTMQTAQKQKGWWQELWLMMENSG